MKSFIAVYEYEGKDQDDLLLMVTIDKKMKLAETPLTSYMFILNKKRGVKILPMQRRNDHVRYVK